MSDSTDRNLIELARAFHGVFLAAMADEEGARERLLSLTHPEIVSVTPAAEMIGGSVEGVDEHDRLLDEMLAAWEQWDTEISNLEVVSGRVIWDSVTHARSRGAGVPYESPRPVSATLEFRDGLLYRWNVFPTREEATAFAEQEAAT